MTRAIASKPTHIVTSIAALRAFCAGLAGRGWTLCGTSLWMACWRFLACARQVAHLNPTRNRGGFTSKTTHEDISHKIGLRKALFEGHHG
eukprot:4781519-Pleurochrysis_carterae.AAC.1